MKYRSIYAFFKAKQIVGLGFVFFFSELNLLNREFIPTNVSKNGTLMVAQPSVGSAHSIAVICFLE